MIIAQEFTEAVPEDNEPDNPYPNEKPRGGWRGFPRFFHLSAPVTSLGATPDGRELGQPRSFEHVVVMQVERSSDPDGYKFQTAVFGTQANGVENMMELVLGYSDCILLDEDKLSAEQALSKLGIEIQQ